VVPTAVQAEAELQETAPSPYPALLEVGVGWMRHLWPFQRSATVPARFIELSNAAPTAVHTEAEVHETAPMPLLAAPGGLGTCWMLHLWPFQRSARRPDAVLPVAVRAEAEVHETPPKKNPRLWEVGVGWMRHLWPFQRSASGPALDPPTAVHDDDVVQATPTRKPPP
jgi:hypothetical protein